MRNKIFLSICSGVIACMLFAGCKKSKDVNQKGLEYSEGLEKVEKEIPDEEEDVQDIEPVASPEELNEIARKLCYVSASYSEGISDMEQYRGYFTDNAWEDVKEFYNMYAPSPYRYEINSEDSSCRESDKYVIYGEDGSKVYLGEEEYIERMTAETQNLWRTRADLKRKYKNAYTYTVVALDLHREVTLAFNKEGYIAMFQEGDEG